MATPSASGSAALLAELYAREFSEVPRASLMKALLIHTADDLGNAGPDYKFGWGLMNVKTAADLILKQKADSVVNAVFYQNEITNAAKEQTFSFVWDGVSPIRATLCWTDAPGTTGRPADDRTPVLVHNLNLKVISPDGTDTFYPFIMPFVGTWTTESMALPATTGVNNVDNVEQVYLAAPSQAGSYTVSVSLPEADTLTTASQSYSLVLTGAGAPVNPPPVVAVTSPATGAVIDPSTGPITVTATATDLDVDRNPGVVTRVECFSNDVSQGLMTEDPSSPGTYSLTITPPGGSVTLRVTATDSEDASASASVSIQYRYSQPGELRSFTPPLANDLVQALAGDGSNRIYIGGKFTKLNTTVDAPRVARLLSDGSIDASFLPGSGPDAMVRVMAFDSPRSGLYVGGDFKNVNGVSQAALVRLAVGKAGLADGEADPDFAPVIEASPFVTPFVRALVVQPDGKILIGGNFSTVNKVSRAFLARIRPDGSLDSGFAPVVPGVVNTIALQADGKILIGGTFGTVNGVQRQNLARLNADGTLDATLDIGSGFNGPINSVAVTLGGDIYAGGSFSSYNALPYYNNLAKLSSTGTIYASFNYSGGLDNQVYDVHQRPGGGILVTGLFRSVSNRVLGGGATVGRVVQFNSDGTIDTAFNAGGSGANGSVLDSLSLPNGDILLAGGFTTFNGVGRARLALVVGYDASKPIMTSPSFHTTAVGEQVDFAFTANAPATFALTGALPVGVSFDATTGRLVGIPLEIGTFELSVIPSTALGTGDPANFRLSVNATTSATGFSAWIDGQFTPGELEDPAVWAPDAILNTLGLSNFAVYALNGGDPRAVPAAALPVVVREPVEGDLYLTLTAPKNPGAFDVVYAVEYSTDLASWSDAPADVVEISNTSTELKVRAAIPVDAASRQFLRLKMLHSKQAF